MIIPARNLGPVAMLLCGFVAAAGAAPAVPPLPFYNSNVVKTVRIGDGSIVIQTKDSPRTVQAWYHLRLRDSNGETATGDGGHILYTHNGATVDIEPGNSFDPLTSIGLVWDAKKHAAFRPVSK